MVACFHLAIYISKRRKYGQKRNTKIHIADSDSYIYLKKYRWKEKKYKRNTKYLLASEDEIQATQKEKLARNAKFRAVLQVMMSELDYLNALRPRRVIIRWFRIWRNRSYLRVAWRSLAVRQTTIYY